MFPEKKGVLDMFRSKPDPKELVRKWQSSLRTEVSTGDQNCFSLQFKRPLHRPLSYSLG
jgi:hypothetical protein